MSQRDAASAPITSAHREAPDLTGPELLASSDRRSVLASLMTAHGDAVYGLCVRILRDHQLAEDVLQQVFVEVYRDLERFQGRSTLRTWIFGIASHRCQDAVKARQRRDRRFQSEGDAIEDFVETAAGPRERLDRAQLVAALEDCLGSLSSETRSAVLLRFQANMSYEEMSDSLDVKADTLRARVARALPSLRLCLEGKGWDGE